MTAQLRDLIRTINKYNNKYYDVKTSDNDYYNIEMFLMLNMRKFKEYHENKKCIRCEYNLFGKTQYYINTETFNNFPKDDVNILCYDCVILHDSLKTQSNTKEKNKLEKWINRNKYIYDLYCFNCCQKNKVCFYQCSYCRNKIDYFKELQDCKE